MRFKIGEKVRVKENWFTIDNCKELIGKIKVIDKVIDSSGLFYYLNDTETIIFEVTDLEIVRVDNLKIGDRVRVDNEIYLIVDIANYNNKIFYDVYNFFNDIHWLSTNDINEVLPHE